MYNIAYTWSHGEVLFSHSSQQTLTIFSLKPKRYLQELRKNYIYGEELRGLHSIVMTIIKRRYLTFFYNT